MRLSVVVVALSLLATSACTGGDGGDREAGSAFEEVDCPPDVEAAVLASITCGYLSVPEDRDDPRRMIQLFVTRVEPRERQYDEPVLVVGTNLGNAPNHAGIAPVAERLGREAILLDARGVGHSEPSLACPEVEALGPRTLEGATTDRELRSAFLDAVADCRQRLETEGVDLDAYRVDTMAADAEDLRMALGIEQWNVHTYGTASRIALEMVRADPDGIRTLFLDSPQTEQVDARVEGALAFDSALGAVATRCRQDQDCRRRFGDARSTLERALVRLEREPQVVDVRDLAGEESADLYIDDVMLLRLLRAVLSDGGSSGSLYLPESVPALISLAADGRLDQIAPLFSPVVVQDTAYCVGYVPKCGSQMALSEGVYYSLLCRDPDIRRTPATAHVADRLTGFAEMFARDPYLDVCDVWGAGTAPTSEPAAIESDIPALVLIGGFATFTRGSTIRHGLRGLSNTTFVVNPRHGHNVLVGACIAEARRVWYDELTLTGRDLACIDPDLPWTRESELLEAAASAGG